MFVFQDNIDNDVIENNNILVDEVENSELSSNQISRLIYDVKRKS